MKASKEIKVTACALAFALATTGCLQDTQPEARRDGNRISVFEMDRSETAKCDHFPSDTSTIPAC